MGFGHRVYKTLIQRQKLSKAADEVLKDLVVMINSAIAKN
jgi:citrate synthase